MKSLKVISIIFALLLMAGCTDKKDTIRLGGTFPLTGNVASYGINAMNGIQLRIDEINEEGGVNGKLISVDFQDDQNSIRDAVSIFNRFATIDRLPLVFGSAGSSVSLSLVPIANRERVVLISPVSSSSKLSTEGGDYFFRTVPSDDIQAEILADWVWEEGIRNIAIVYTNNSWGRPLTEAFTEFFTAKGGNVVLSEGTSEDITDFRTVILRLRRLNFDAIFSPTYPKEGGHFVKQLIENRITTRLFGGDNWGAPEFLTIAGSAAEGVNFTFPSDSQSPLWDSFVVNYREKYGVDPDIIAAYGYDAASAVVEALKNVEEISSENIREQLLLVDFEGVSDRIAFKENGDIISQGFGKRRIENVKIISIN